MIIDGISCKGSYHDINQDSFRIIHRDELFAIVVSDGLGSLEKSQIGSQKICESVEEYFTENTIARLSQIGPQKWVEEIHLLWKTKVGDEISKCYATFLLVVNLKDKIFAIRLGDGFISLLFNDKSKILYDKKEEYLVNETDCFYEKLEKEKIEYFESTFNDLICCLLSTDGFVIGDMSEDIVKEFTLDFAKENQNVNKNDLKKSVEDWFLEWPGIDDKTLVYFLKEEYDGKPIH